ncbi:hypothetical protein LHYA1_G001862 [Lachnellula hyalina]|uniref:Uncharacterized protein n=1 Tax=Lachnellula hyalina TaxID=1316788 RepID=A0A8H8R6G1_9HELO|nr:uncharacterized protein LHYA1_G001862 [Lachnellula hyalina]TVY29429.1 hypothetical protein LHYA1_G001862 [Lachnellula hyalina]
MNAITILVSALCLALLQFSVRADSAHAFWFLPSAPITRFQSTMVVPSTPGGGLHAVWPGLENESEGFVFQSVLSDSNGAGSWTFFVEYCCNPNYVYTPIKVYPGDSITSTFSLDNGLWTDAWSLAPGAIGSANGQIPQTGSSSNSFSNEGALTRGLLAIELKNEGTWDFGPVLWTDISVTASTTSPWCASGYGTTALNYQISGGVQSSSDSSTTCTYQSLQFIGPS